MFNRLAETVASTTTTPVPCDFAIPPPPTDEAIDYTRVEVTFQQSATEVGLVEYTDSAATCGGAGGFYYDNPAAPTQIILCPTSCDQVNTAGEEARIDITFPCQPPPPPEPDPIN